MACAMANLNYQRPPDANEDDDEDDDEPTITIPAYSDILHGSSLLCIGGNILIGLGGLAVLIGPIGGALSASDAAGALGGALAGFVGGAVVGVGIAVVGVLVRLFAAMALAHRDMARNSFRALADK